MGILGKLIYTGVVAGLTWFGTEASHQAEFRELESFHETERQSLTFYYKVWVVKRFNLRTQDQFAAFKQGWDARDEIRRLTMIHHKDYSK